MNVYVEHDDPGVVAVELITAAQRLVDRYGDTIGSGELERLGVVTAELLHAVDVLETLEALDLADGLEDRRKETS